MKTARTASKNCKQESEVRIGPYEVVAQYKALMPAVQKACTILSEHMFDAGTTHVVFDIDDTLIFDNERETPNLQIKHLLAVAKAHGAMVHLITARERGAEVSKWTRDQLRRHGIVYDTLALAPKEARVDMAAVAEWKHAQRASHGRVLMSVGDQWGDCILITDEEMIGLLDKRHNVTKGPWVIIKPNDGVTMYALKLMASKY